MDLNSNRKVHGSSALSAALKVPSTSDAQYSSHQEEGSPGSLHSSGFWSAAQASPLASPVIKPRPSPTASPSSSKLLPTILPFWSCFTSRTGAVDDAHSSAVVSAEVGIRPSFYWLDADVSEEERLFAEANARWMKNDCQDDVVVVPNFANLPCQIFAGVFDGHGPYGRMAATCASTQMPALLAGSGAMTLRAGDKKRLRAMRDACAAVDAFMRDSQLCGFDASLSGTTACFAVVCGRKVYLANTGDSRCVLARRCHSGSGTEAIQMTWDAKPDHPEELKRIRNAGGVVSQLRDESGERVGAHRVFRRGDDVLPGLAMSRSLGDLYAHAVGVTNEPVLSTYTLGERDLFLVLGTDGLWDIMSNEEVVDFIERYRNGRAQGLSCAEALTLEAQERWKARHEEALVDDISVAIIHMAPLGPVDRSAHVRSPLAHAASCNDEANALFRSWQLDGGRNPSNHAPRRFFQHLYQSGGGSSSGGTGDAPQMPLRRQQSEGAVLCSAASQGEVAEGPLELRERAMSLDEAGVSRLRLAAAAAAGEQQQSPQRRQDSSSGGGRCSGLPSPLGSRLGAGAGATSQQQQQQGHLFAERGSRRITIPSAGVHLPASPFPAAAAAAAAASLAHHQQQQQQRQQFVPSALQPQHSLPSTVSSLDCSDSEHGQTRLLGVGAGGSKFTGAFARPSSATSAPAPAVAPSSPIPCAPQPHSVDSFFRPIRKAYPSQSGNLGSLRSENSVFMNTEEMVPRTPSTEAGDSRGSTQGRNFGYQSINQSITLPTAADSAVDASFGYEGKLRGGLPRTISAPILAHAAKWAGPHETPALSSSFQAVSLDERTLGHMASGGLTDSPSDSNSTLSSPYPTLSPVGPALGAPYPQCPPFAKSAVHVVPAAGAGGGSVVFPPAAPPPASLMRSVSEAMRLMRSSQ